MNILSKPVIISLFIGLFILVGVYKVLIWCIELCLMMMFYFKFTRKEKTE